MLDVVLNDLGRNRFPGAAWHAASSEPSPSGLGARSALGKPQTGPFCAHSDDPRSPWPKVLGCFGPRKAKFTMTDGREPELEAPSFLKTRGSVIWFSMVLHFEKPPFASKPEEL